jgi:hypothetical protein
VRETPTLCETIGRRLCAAVGSACRRDRRIGDRAGRAWKSEGSAKEGADWERHVGLVGGGVGVGWGWRGMIQRRERSRCRF